MATLLAAALVIFLVFHYWLLLDDPGSLTDLDWARRTYILGGLEALVFAGAGFLFGTQISRGTVKAAEKQAEEASERASEAQERAEQQGKRADEKAEEAQKQSILASKGKMLASAVRAKQERANLVPPPGAEDEGAPGPEESLGRRRGGGGRRREAGAAMDDLAELAELARELDGA